MSEPDPYSEHVASLFSEPAESEPVESPPSEEPDSHSETLEPAVGDSAAEPSPTQPSSDWERVAQARLREINSLRESSRETRDRMAEIEKRFQALSAQIAPGDEIPQELLEADPALRYVTGKLKAIEDQLQTGQRSQQENAQFTREVADTVRYAQESRQAFVSHTPAWDEAYKFMRDAFAQANGKVGAPDRDEWLNVQEHLAVQEWRRNGEDPALKIYEMAVANGWKPGQATAVPPPPAPTNGQAARVRRVRDAVAAPSPASIGVRDMGADVMSREQFYDQFPQSERVRIFNSDRGEDIFESLMKEGRVSRSLLPSSGGR